MCVGGVPVINLLPFSSKSAFSNVFCNNSWNSFKHFITKCTMLNFLSERHWRDTEGEGVSLAARFINGVGVKTTQVVLCQVISQNTRSLGDLAAPA